jgi:lysophospholipase L1-like esterase
MSRPAAENWIGTWATAAQPALGAPVEYNDQTLRLIVHTSIGGDAVRVRFSNAFGSTPLEIGGARVARRAVQASIQDGTDRALMVGGRDSFTIPTGAAVWTDPVDLGVEALSDLALSIYLPNQTRAETDHFLALQTSYMSHRDGDVGSAVDLPGATPVTTWPFVTGVDVRTSARGCAVVAFGDSIAEGAASTLDTNRRWPDLLAARLQSSEGAAHVGVLNAGLMGNRLLFGSPPDRPFHGAAAFTRFVRDVCSQTGVKYVIVALGLNDIGFAGSVTPTFEQVSAADLIAGYRQLIRRAHEDGIQVIGSTITPFKAAVSAEGFYTSDKDSVREEANSWIRTSGEFDEVIDFDRALRDPVRPSMLAPEFDSGDHMHPSDAGHRAMAEAVDLAMLRQTTGLPATEL